MISLKNDRLKLKPEIAEVIVFGICLSAWLLKYETTANRLELQEVAKKQHGNTPEKAIVLFHYLKPLVQLVEEVRTYHTNFINNQYDQLFQCGPQFVE